MKNLFGPLLCRVYYEPDLYKAFVVAVYCGSSKPKLVNNYFDLSIQELNDLQRDGIVLHGKHFNLSLICISADKPACDKSDPEHHIDNSALENI